MAVEDKDIEVLHKRIEKYAKKQDELEKGHNELKLEVALARQRQMNFEKTIKEKLDTIIESLGQHAKSAKEKWLIFIKSFAAPIAVAVLLSLLIKGV